MNRLSTIRRMTSGAILALYITGGALELGGIAVVGWDVFESSRRLRKMSQPNWGLQQAQQGQQVRSLFALIAEVTAGNVTRRAIGVALLAVGLVVQTTGNIASL